MSAGFLSLSLLCGPLILGGGHLFQSSRGVEALRDMVSGQLLLQENGTLILQYNYCTVEPGPVLERVSQENLKYARARSNYIHPLYGFQGEELTRDWPPDHPHHRGIYWAWPEVRFRGELGDLHALQKVFARPTGKYRLASGAGFGDVEGESLWVWEDQVAIVRETAIIRAYSGDRNGRLIDLEFRLRALEEGISLARRDSDKYGGLSLRLNTVAEQEISLHTDPAGRLPRMAWSQLSGLFEGRHPRQGISVFQHRDNPDFPGDWIEYPELNWAQPAFPASGKHYSLEPGKTLVLRYRLWIHVGVRGEEEHRKQWEEYGRTPPIGGK